jgi:pseudaminic acid synthase
MQFKIGDKLVGDNQPVYIVAEISANHLQKYESAVKTIKAAKKAGADAIKIQTYTADTITIDCNNKYFQIKGGTIWDGQTFYKLYQEAYTPWEWQPKLKKIAEELGMGFFSSPFDKTAVDFLEKMKVPAYKIGSPEIVDIPFIEYAASKGKPMMISTGIAREFEIRDAVNACRRVGNNQIALLKCSSAYPTPLDELNLKVIPDLAKRFKVIPGLSDHTIDVNVAIASVALGAKIVEKHIILDRKMGGPDSEFSLEPTEFSQMVGGIRDVEKALGKVTYELSDNVKVARRGARSLFVVEDVEKGERFTEKNVRSIRPSFGMPPKYLYRILGKKAKRDIERGTPLKSKLIK